jgi:hypothetical protein
MGKVEFVQSWCARRTVREMRVGLSQPGGRAGLQIGLSCDG